MLQVLHALIGDLYDRRAGNMTAVQSRIDLLMRRASAVHVCLTSTPAAKQSKLTTFMTPTGMMNNTCRLQADPTGRQMTKLNGLLFMAAHGQGADNHHTRIYIRRHLDCTCWTIHIAPLEMQAATRWRFIS